ncbi:hypothetical protein GQ42DRAFT_7276 [Ramicandelaber brevisporus]|nr:hypothetical protein GQ42DRAFT_7276 [Ramicandelaber brevisporus]
MPSNIPLARPVSFTETASASPASSNAHTSSSRLTSSTPSTAFAPPSPLRPAEPVVPPHPISTMHSNVEFACRRIKVGVSNTTSAMSISPNEQQLILSGSNGFQLLDLNNPFEKPTGIPFRVGGDVVTVKWSKLPHNDDLVAATAGGGGGGSSGFVILSVSKQNSGNGVPCLHISGAHSRAISGLDWNNHHPMIIASCSIDQLVKVWDIRNTSAPANVMRPSTRFSSISSAITQQQHQQYQHHSTANAVSFHPTNPNHLAYTQSNSLIVTDWRHSRRPLHEIMLPGRRANSIAWHPLNSNMLSVGITDNRFVEIDLGLIKSDSEMQGIKQYKMPGTVGKLEYAPFGSGIIATPSRSLSRLMMAQTTGDCSDSLHNLQQHQNCGIKLLQRHSGGIRTFVVRQYKHIDSTNNSIMYDEDYDDDLPYQLITLGYDQTLRMSPLVRETTNWLKPYYSNRHSSSADVGFDDVINRHPIRAIPRNNQLNTVDENGEEFNRREIWSGGRASGWRFLFQHAPHDAAVFGPGDFPPSLYHPNAVPFRDTMSQIEWLRHFAIEQPQYKEPYINARYHELGLAGTGQSPISSALAQMHTMAEDLWRIVQLFAQVRILFINLEMRVFVLDIHARWPNYELESYVRVSISCPPDYPHSPPSITTQNATLKQQPQQSQYQQQPQPQHQQQHHQRPTQTHDGSSTTNSSGEHKENPSADELFQQINVILKDVVMKFYGDGIPPIVPCVQFIATGTRRIHNVKIPSQVVHRFAHLVTVATRRVAEGAFLSVSLGSGKHHGSGGGAQAYRYKKDQGRQLKPGEASSLSMGVVVPCPRLFSATFSSSGKLVCVFASLVTNTTLMRSSRKLNNMVYHTSRMDSTMPNYYHQLRGIITNWARFTNRSGTTKLTLAHAPVGNNTNANRNIHDDAGSAIRGKIQQLPQVKDDPESRVLRMIEYGKKWFNPSSDPSHIVGTKVSTFDTSIDAASGRLAADDSAELPTPYGNLAMIFDMDGYDLFDDDSIAATRFIVDPAVDTLSKCNINRAVAESMNRPDLAQAFQLISMLDTIFSSLRSNSSSSTGSSSNTSSGQSRHGILSDAAHGVRFGLKWIERILVHLDNRRDVIGLGVISCILLVILRRYYDEWIQIYNILETSDGAHVVSSIPHGFDHNLGICEGINVAFHQTPLPFKQRSDVRVPISVIQPNTQLLSHTVKAALSRDPSEMSPMPDIGSPSDLDLLFHSPQQPPQQPVPTSVAADISSVLQYQAVTPLSPLQIRPSAGPRTSSDLGTYQIAADITGNSLMLGDASVPAPASLLRIHHGTSLQPTIGGSGIRRQRGNSGSVSIERPFDSMHGLGVKQFDPSPVKPNRMVPLSRPATEFYSDFQGPSAHYFPPAIVRDPRRSLAGMPPPSVAVIESPLHASAKAHRSTVSSGVSSGVHLPQPPYSSEPPRVQPTSAPLGHPMPTSAQRVGSRLSQSSQDTPQIKRRRSNTQIIPKASHHPTTSHPLGQPIGQAVTQPGSAGFAASSSGSSASLLGDLSGSFDPNQQLQSLHPPQPHSAGHEISRFAAHSTSLLSSSGPSLAQLNVGSPEPNSALYSNSPKLVAGSSDGSNTSGHPPMMVNAMSFSSNISAQSAASSTTMAISALANSSFRSISPQVGSLPNASLNAASFAAHPGVFGRAHSDQSVSINGSRQPQLNQRLPAVSELAQSESSIHVQQQKQQQQQQQQHSRRVHVKKNVVVNGYLSVKQSPAQSFAANRALPMSTSSVSNSHSLLHFTFGALRRMLEKWCVIYADLLDTMNMSIRRLEALDCLVSYNLRAKWLQPSLDLVAQPIVTANQHANASVTVRLAKNVSIKLRMLKDEVNILQELAQTWSKFVSGDQLVGLDFFMHPVIQSAVDMTNGLSQRLLMPPSATEEVTTRLENNDEDIDNDAGADDDIEYDEADVPVNGGVVCSVCMMAVAGLVYTCLKCFHGGHPECYAHWLVECVGPAIRDKRDRYDREQNRIMGTLRQTVPISPLTATAIHIPPSSTPHIVPSIATKVTAGEDTSGDKGSSSPSPSPLNQQSIDMIPTSDVNKLGILISQSITAPVPQTPALNASVSTATTAMTAHPRPRLPIPATATATINAAPPPGTALTSPLHVQRKHIHDMLDIDTENTSRLSRQVAQLREHFNAGSPSTSSSPIGGGDPSVAANTVATLHGATLALRGGNGGLERPSGLGSLATTPSVMAVQSSIISPPQPTSATTTTSQNLAITGNIVSILSPTISQQVNEMASSVKAAPTVPDMHVQPLLKRQPSAIQQQLQQQQQQQQQPTALQMSMSQHKLPEPQQPQSRFPPWIDQDADLAQLFNMPCPQGCGCNCLTPPV